MKITYNEIKGNYKEILEKHIEAFESLKAEERYAEVRSTMMEEEIEDYKNALANFDETFDEWFSVKSFERNPISDRTFETEEEKQKYLIFWNQDEEILKMKYAADVGDEFCCIDNNPDKWCYPNRDAVDFNSDKEMMYSLNVKDIKESMYDTLRYERGVIRYVEDEDEYRGELYWF